MSIVYCARHQVFASLDFDKAGDAAVLLPPKATKADPSNVTAHLVKSVRSSVSEQVRECIVDLVLLLVEFLDVFERCGHINVHAEITRWVRGF